MKVLENGDYLLDDGRVIPKDEIGKLHEKAASKKKEPDEDDLQEGQCSGPRQLNEGVTTDA